MLRKVKLNPETDIVINIFTVKVGLLKTLTIAVPVLYTCTVLLLKYKALLKVFFKT